MSGSIAIDRRKTEHREIRRERRTGIQSLPENVPVAQEASVREDQMVRKERKRREKEARREYQELGKQGRLLFLEKGGGLDMFQNHMALKQWDDTKTKHIGLPLRNLLAKQASDKRSALKLFPILPEQAEQGKPLLSREAADLVSQGQAFSLCAVENGEACGAICARFSEGWQDAVELIHLYVAPSHRQRGIGGALLLELLDELTDFTGGELCRVEAMFSETAEGMMEFLQAAGFSLETEETACTWRIPVAALADAPLLQRKTASHPQGLFFLESLDIHQRKQLYHNLKRYDADYLSMEELEHAHPKLSYVLLGAGNSLDACSILDMQEEGVYCLRQFFCTPHHTTATLPVLQASARALLTFCPGEAVLEIPTVTEPAAQLAHRLLPKGTACRHMMCAVLNLHESRELFRGF